MNLENFAKSVEEKAKELSFGIGIDEDKLPEMKYSEHDIDKIKNAKEMGEVKVEGNKLTATELCASVAAELFLQYGDDEAEYIIEEEIKSSRIKEAHNVGSFHFIKTFDEDEWMCLKTFTKYGIGELSLKTNNFSIEEIIPETGRTDDLDELVKYVHSVDRDLTENQGEHVKNQYNFQCGGFAGISYR